MRRVTIAAVACAFCAGLAASSLFSVPAAAQDEGAPPIPADMQEMWAEYMALGEPGPKHEMLDRFVGEWTVTTTISMPGVEPMVSEGTATTEWAMDGRWLVTKQSGTMMGRPYQGMGVMGHDNYKNRFVQTWCDSMSTAFAYSEGEAAPDGSAFFFSGTMDEPMMRMHDRAATYIIRVESDDRHVFEIHDPALEIGGMPTKVVEMVYTRAD